MNTKQVYLSRAAKSYILPLAALDNRSDLISERKVRTPPRGTFGEAGEQSNG